MHVSVNGVRLFFDVEGAKFAPEGPIMRERPTLLMLHGGPGADHSIYRPAYSALSDLAQIIYLDHRGNGRSDDGPRESWNLAQWGDDVRVLRCVGDRRSNRARRILWRHDRAVLCHAPSGSPGQAGAHQH
jgi:pimeloyl-ACP methyl ester carboxylesterase